MMRHTAIREEDRVTGNWHGRGAIIATHDDARSIIRIASDGLWTPEQVDRHFDEMARLIANVRTKGRRVRVLVDRRDSLDQPATTDERIRIRSDGLFDIGDRVAVVVPHCLAKLQFRGALNEQTHRVFISEEAAMMWLKAYD